MISSRSPATLTDRLLDNERAACANLTELQREAWQHVRFYVLTDIISHECKMEAPSEHTLRQSAMRLMGALNDAGRLIYSLRKLREAELIFAVHERAKDGDDPYIADLVSATERDAARRSRTVFLCDSRSRKRSDPRFVSIEPVLAASKIISFLHAFTGIGGHERDALFYKALLGEDFSFNQATLTRFIRRKKEKQVSSSILGRLLKGPRVKSLVLSVSYCKTEIISAVRSNNREAIVIEMQHGLISNYHLGYSGGANHPALTPSALALFGNAWMRFNDAPRFNATTVGNNLMRPRSSNWIIPLKTSKNILIISQRTVSLYIARYMEEELLRNEEVEFIVKLHPSEYARSAYEKLASTSRVHIIRHAPHDNPVSVSHIVGVYSTLLLELVEQGFSVNILEVAGSEKLPMDRSRLNLVASLEVGRLVPAYQSPNGGDSYFEEFDAERALKLLSKGTLE